MRVLLAVDASPDSRQAAEAVKALAQPPDLHVLNVVEAEALPHAYDAAALPSGWDEHYRREVSEAAEQVLHEMKAELAPHAGRIRLIADTGDAAESIIETAAESRADLIVMGQRGMTATPAFLLGGVSQKVATYAPCSVLIIKDWRGMLDRVLLAVDGSKSSEEAVRFLARRPFRPPLLVKAIMVWPDRPGILRGAGSARRAKAAAKTAKAHGEKALRDFVLPLVKGPYQLESEWRTGDPALALLEAAQRDDVRMIVLGARGLTGVKRFLLGSVSQKVLVHAPCSVLIVR